MAFCSKCGTQLNDGAKFCPNCGQSTSGSEIDSVLNYNDDSENEEKQIKTWQKIVSVLFWPAGAILIIMALIKKQSELAKSAVTYTAIGIGLAIGLNVALGGCSNDSTQTVLSIDSYDNNEADYDDVAEVGYKSGYEMGFQLGGSSVGEYYDGTENIQIIYTNFYPAPSSPEEKKMYNIFAENYKRGFKDGKNAAK